jgi:hypothetical protein
VGHVKLMFIRGTDQKPEPPVTVPARSRSVPARSRFGEGKVGEGKAPVASGVQGAYAPMNN